ncbi:response regulator transcription factor [Nocardioides sp. HDW12B]|uniref:response regulator transcription factor n=1 Tax=Nocardioides sp. HDW12B TaxID=2714939 RepID=UPI001980F8F7|nr:response regulator transcription factor [Nocardioides sp. HDW12B]
MVSEPIRVLLADDQVLVRDALATLLDLEPDLSVVVRVTRGDEVEAAVAQHAPDVCLLDIEMPGLDGIAACRAVTARFSDVRVLMVTTFGRPGYLTRALDAGATGFVVKDIPGDQLADAVRRVAAGHRVVDPALATETLLGGRSPLTEREAELLRLAVEGTPVAQMASRLFLSPGTVRNHLSAAIRKTGTTTRVEAARAAQDRGWL